MHVDFVVFCNYMEPGEYCGKVQYHLCAVWGLRFVIPSSSLDTGTLCHVWTLVHSSTFGDRVFALLCLCARGCTEMLNALHCVAACTCDAHRDRAAILHSTPHHRHRHAQLRSSTKHLRTAAQDFQTHVCVTSYLHVVPRATAPGRTACNLNSCCGASKAPPFSQTKAYVYLKLCINPEFKTYMY